MKNAAQPEINYQFELGEQAHDHFHASSPSFEVHALRHIAEVVIDKFHGTWKAVRLDIPGTATYAVDLDELDDGLPESCVVYSVEDGRFTLIDIISGGRAREHPQRELHTRCRCPCL